MHAPAVVFTYNQPEKTRITLDALNANTIAHRTDLFLFNEAPDPEKEGDEEAVREVRKVMQDFKQRCRFRSITIFCAERFNGASKSIVTGVTKIINHYGEVTVTSDDVLCSENYLEFMNSALNYYSGYENIWSISGCSFPLKSTAETDDVYFTYRPGTRGWATWKDRWETTDWQMKESSPLLHPSRAANLTAAGKDLPALLRKQKQKKTGGWEVPWIFEATRNQKLTVYPARSLLFEQTEDADLSAVPYRFCTPVLDQKTLSEFSGQFRK